MMRPILSKRTRWAAQARRVAAVGLALSLGALLGASAQSPNDTASGPLPHSWQSVHAGGTSLGPFVTTGNPVPDPNLLSTYQMGTPTGTVNGQFDEMSSFLLGNFDPANPPGAAGTASPNNFRDSAPFNILQWFAPFPFTYPTATSSNGSSTFSVDDAAGTPNFTTPLGTWASENAGTAIGGEYVRIAAIASNGQTGSNDVSSKNGATATALWKITLPASTTTTNTSGFYVVTFHIPDAGTVATLPEGRITDAHYVVTTPGQTTPLANVRVSQSEANANEALAGPLFLQAGQEIDITLDNTTQNTIPANAFVIADQISLQPGFGADVQSTPTAVDETEYPEIQNALYYGVLGQKSTTLVNGVAVLGEPDTVPYGDPNVVTNPKPDYSTDQLGTNPQHRIRQLVYFGRSENIVLQDSSGNLVNDAGSTKDAKGNTITTPIIRHVGAIYCVDGFTGGVIWRYQTPTILTLTTDANGKAAYVQAAASREVFSSPAIARINVLTHDYEIPAGGTTLQPVYRRQTRLVVIVGDNNGMVYCLDAIGNRNGTSNSNAVSANDQPIYNPTAGLNEVTTSGAATIHAHVGTTTPFWIYRPDPNQPKLHTLPIDPTSDLPAPGSFGTASPVVYVDPSAAANPLNVNNVYQGTYPGDTSDNASLPNNGYVYIGNANGTLYKFDAFGVAPPSAASPQAPFLPAFDQFNTAKPINDLQVPAAVNDPAGSTIPTCQPEWWLPLNGSKTSQSGSATTGGGYESIVSAPAFRLVTDPASNTKTGLTLATGANAGEVYFTSADDTDNEGRLYAISGAGPIKDINGNLIKPGSTGFNDKAITDWEFPNRYARPGTSNPAQKAIQPALGSVTGSPVVFTNPDGAYDLRDPSNRALLPSPTYTVSPTTPTRIYFAASSGEEPTDTERPSVEETGRIWSVEADTITATLAGSNPLQTITIYPGMAAWAFPDTIDPNGVSGTGVTLNGTAVSATAPSPVPIGAFRFATPAIGMVQFPTVINQDNTTTPATAYTHGDQNGVRADIKGQVVPMLYVGSAGTGVGQQGPRFYGLDLDGVNDPERTIFQDTETTTGTTPTTVTTPGIASPGGSITTSPALVVNSTSPTATNPGNGGALFVGIGTDLYQISATPVTSPDVTAKQVIIPTEAIVAGTGAISSPSIAGANVFDEVTALGGTLPTTGVFATHNVTDWVYFSDSGLGLAEGITPENQNGGLGTGLTNIVPTPPPGLENFVIPQFPLYTYEFDGNTSTTPQHLGTDPDMTHANKIGDYLPVFEWGQNNYLRIGNVIPPNPGDPATGTDNKALHIFDPDTVNPDKTGNVDLTTGQVVFFSDGGPVTIQISDIDSGSNQPLQTDSGQVPASLLPSLDPTKLSPAEPVGTAPPNGFINRLDPSSNGHFIVGPPPHNNERLGAAIAGATQKVDGDNIGIDNGWIGAYTYAIRDGSARRNTPGTTRRVVNATQIAKAYRYEVLQGNTVPTPVFLGSVTLQTTITGGSEATTTNGKTIAVDAVDQPTFGILNPLAVRGGGTPLFTGTNGANQIGMDIGPFAGIDASNSTQNLPANDLPALGNGNSYPADYTELKNGVLASPATIQRARRFAIVSVGDINHGSSGDNTDPKAGAAPTGTHTAPIAQGAKFGKYSLDIADRSALGLGGQGLQNVTIQAQTLRWNDNSSVSGVRANGPGAIVNYLPWETLPHSRGAGSNTSLDYPDISSNNLSLYLYANNGNLIGNVTNKPAIPDSATGTITNVSGRTVYADPVQEQVSVPRYQPANLQLFDTTQGRIAPDSIKTTGTDEYPMGYVARQYVFVDSNHNGQYDAGEAYRSIQTFSGVPVDMTTTIENSTTDLGKLPQSFGVQTQASGLGPLTPYTTTNYLQFFKPLTVLNRGNTNLLNVHLDQKTDFSAVDAAAIAGSSEANAVPLNLLSDTLDRLTNIPAFDALGVTGPRSNGEQAYLLRSSLDPDLVTASGRNPTIAGASYSSFYPGATFHKSRVSAATPTTLLVPDAPDGITVTFTQQKPLIALAVPLGTPVGSYHQNVRLFEGMDPGGYTNIYNPGTTTGPYVPILPPRYGGAEISGVTTTGPTIPSYAATPANLNDAWMLPGGTSAQPYSTPTVVKATVTETRITDGSSRGNLPQVDTGGAATGGKSSADFMPSAFRSTSGDISLYWTSARDATATTPPYSVFGANLPFNSNGYFAAATPATNWWKPITIPTPANSGSGGFYSTLSVAADPTGTAASYAFVQNIARSGAAYTDALYCYPIGALGALGTTAYPVALNPGQAYNGVKGLTFDATTFPAKGFSDPIDSTKTVTNNLWAFWYGGSRGRSAIYYTSAVAAGNKPGTFTAPAVLPVPAGLSSVADPNPVLTYAPDASGNAIPVIEVTYTGIAPDGNSDIYVTRYRPYFVRDSKGNVTTQVALALAAAPTINEQLALTAGNLYWQARDVAWANPFYKTGANGPTATVNGIDLTVNGTALGLTALQPVYDRASGMLVFTNVKNVSSGGQNVTENVYIDLARGRVRFSQPLAGAGTSPPTVFATFSPTARRITTDSRADTLPVSFLDQTYKDNELPSLGRVQTSRYWYLWRKSGASGTSTTPTLWYKTQRLSLYLHDATNLPINLSLGTNGKPTQLTLTDQSASNPIANTDLIANVDVDWARGRLYFPTTINGIATEGHLIKVAFDYINSAGKTGTYTLTDAIHWLDEPRFNETTGTSLAVNPTTTGGSAQSASAIGETPIPIDTITNESNVTAFLDPLAYQYDTAAGTKQTDVPHKVWLFWNSTRNGTADLYYETVDPLFSVSVGQ